MGGCMNGRRNPENAIRHGKGHYYKLKASEEKYRGLLQDDQKVFSQKHHSYFSRKFQIICGSPHTALTEENMRLIFAYLNFKEQIIHRLYSQFTKKSKILHQNFFLAEVQFLMNLKDKGLAFQLYNLFFHKIHAGFDLVESFHSEFKPFLRINGNKMEQREKNLTESLQNLRQVLDRRKNYEDKKQTMSWLKKNVNFISFRKFFLEKGIQIDEKQAYKILKEDDTILKTNGEFALISKSWFDKLEQYMIKKYAGNQYHSSVVPKTAFRSQFKKIGKNENEGLNASDTGLIMEMKQETLLKNKKNEEEGSIKSQNYPGEIDNSILSGYFEWEIRKNIKPNDYKIINTQTYKKLYLSFGGGPKFIRKVSKGYVELKAFFVKTYRFRYDAQKKQGSLIHQDLTMLSANDDLKNIFEKQTKQFAVYHRNYGCNWEEFPFPQLQGVDDITVDDVFAQTSFLVYMLEENRKYFHQQFIQKKEINDYPVIGDMFQKVKSRSLTSQGEKICVLKVQDFQEQKIVRYVSLQEVHPQKQLKISQFLQKFQLSHKKMANTIKRKNARGGIQNLGNTCYLNSTLQVLIAARRGDQMFSSNGEMSREIIKLIDKIENKKKSVFPLEFKTVFDGIFRQFEGNQQQDAHEFLIRLLEILQKQNGSKLKKEFDAEIQTQFKCQKCLKAKIKHQEARIISLPLNDYDKKQMKIDFVKQNRNVTTLRFEVDPEMKGLEWIQMFKQITGAKNIFMCELHNAEIIRTFRTQDLALSIKSLRISSQDYLVAYQIELFESKIEIDQLEYEFYYFEEGKSIKLVKLLGFKRSSIVEDPRKNETVLDPEVKIVDIEGNYNEILQSQLINYPSPQGYQDLLIKIINFDKDYDERIGIPFVIRVMNFQPIKVIRIYLQKLLGKDGYYIRIAPKKNLQQCYVCQKMFCSGMKCFQNIEDSYPVQWLHKKVQYIVRWDSSFEYREHLKRNKKVASNLHRDYVEMDHIEKALTLFSQPQNTEMVCTLCHKRTMKSRQTISKWPKILVFHLKRFRNINGKLIKIFTKWKLQKEFYVANLRYKLKGIILHSGLTINEGHYTAVIDGFKYDNEVIKECQLEDILPEQIYMLFYVLV